MNGQIIEVEADSLEEAREQLRTQTPQGFRLVSEEITSHGGTRTAKAAADTIEAASVKAQGEIPVNAKVLEKKEFTAPAKRVMIVEAFDLEGANKEARKQIGSAEVLNGLKLVLASKKGFLGVGKKAAQYEAEVSQPAIVEFTYKVPYKMKAKLVTEISDEFSLLLADKLKVIFSYKERITNAEALTNMRGNRLVDNVFNTAVQQRLSFSISRPADPYSNLISNPGFAPTTSKSIMLSIVDVQLLAKSGLSGFCSSVNEELAPLENDFVQLLRSRKQEAVRALLLIYADEHKYSIAEFRELVRHYLMEKLGSDVIDEIITALQHDNEYVRFHTVLLLGIKKDSRAIEPLIMLLRDTDKDVRRIAALALGEFNDRRAVEPLEQLSQTDPEPLVLQAARMSLQKLRV